MLKDELEKEARKFAMKNALDYGKADTGAVLSKMLAVNPDLRSNIKEISGLVRKVVEEVNRIGRADIESEFKAYSEEFREKEKLKEEQSSKPRMELEGAVIGKFATRYPPEPNGYINIGSAKAIWLGRVFADIYKGTDSLYFDDTNPEKESQKYVDAIKMDLEWLGVRFDREYYASDHMHILYKCAEKLLEENNAYVCTCEREKMKELRFAGKECEHRKNTKAKNVELWKKMLAGGFKDNEAVLRLKLDMKSLNTTMRDPVLCRIVTHVHYRQGSKYAVWPTYDFNTPVIDSVEGITDGIKDKHWEIRDELGNKLLDLLKMRKPRLRAMSRLEIEGNTTSKRKVNELIQKGILLGYDDPRLVTISAVRRRGIQPQAIKNFVLRFGMSKTDSVVSMDMLLAENRKVIDPIAKHLFFVKDPVKVALKGARKLDAKLRLHPSKDFGFREYETDGVFYISGDDAKVLKKDEVVRLKDLLAIKINSNTGGEIKAEPVSETRDGKIIQWVSDKNYFECSVLDPEAPLDEKGNARKDSLKVEKGYVENYAAKLNEHEIVQFERFGYCILDDRKKNQFVLISK